MIAVATLFVSCQKKQGPNPAAMMMMMTVPVRAVPAVSSDVPLRVAAVGTVEAVNSVDVKSRVAGQIIRVDFREGDDVRAGQLLFEIDPEPLHRQIAELEAEIAKDNALEQQARANLAKDQAQLKQARAAADRGEALSKDGIYSKEQTEQVVATADAAQASLQADQAALESATASKTADTAKLAETKLQLDYTRITAPITGRAGAVSAKAGNLIKDNDTALVNILQVSPIYVAFGVPEQMLGDIRRNNAQQALPVVADVQGQGSETGKLNFIDNTVDNTTGMVKLKAVFNNPKRALWPGQFVNVQAQIQTERGRILIPSRTLQNGPDGKYVWVMDAANNTVAMRPVKVLRLVQEGTGTVEEAVLAGGRKTRRDGGVRRADAVSARCQGALAARLGAD